MISMNEHTQSLAKSVSIKAVVFNADGTMKQDLGTIAYWHKNPLKRWAWSVSQFFKKLNFGGTK